MFEKEETGIEAHNWRKLVEADLSNSATDERATIYLATGLTEGEAQPEDTEVLAFGGDPVFRPSGSEFIWRVRALLPDHPQKAQAIGQPIRRTIFGDEPKQKP